MRWGRRPQPAMTRVQDGEVIHSITTAQHWEGGQHPDEPQPRSPAQASEPADGGTLGP